MGRVVGVLNAAPDFEAAAALTVGDRLSCGCQVEVRDIPCGWHRVRPGYAMPGCRRCQNGQLGVWHRTGCPGPATTQGDQP
jgi:hypothetical protein